MRDMNGMEYGRRTEGIDVGLLIVSSTVKHLRGGPSDGADIARHHLLLVNHATYTKVAQLD